MKRISVFILLFISTASFAGVNITSPANGSGVGAPIHVTASASPNSGRVISSMAIYLDNVLVQTKYANWVDTSIASGAGWHTVLVKSWDNYGGIYQSSSAVNVGGQASTPPTTVPAAGAGTLWNIDQLGGWLSCSVCAGAGGTGPSAAIGLKQNVASPSLDGRSAQFWIGGSTPYSDALWWYKVMYDSAANNNAHHFVYDFYFYTNDPTAAQAIEFDVNQFVAGRSLIYGSQCSYRGTGAWEIWDNPNSRWVSTGIRCPALAAYQWQHVVLEVERTSDNKLRYVALTLNGAKHYLNWYNSSTATSWKGITVNYQMDGNYRQQNYSTWVDKMSLTYW